MAGHVFKCALCGERVSSDVRPARCPKCGGKAFVHEEGEPLRRKAGCTGSCGGCSGCCH
ncbi:regulatory protein [Pyramidobacter piscolens]|uniref:Rubredoxin-like domain-containing protein n=1 Tax=Pyramidobacter piscolens W5455 TaxID=352165 RepID=A0ABM9ZS09_9BACT|nr:regulatory protein [Pyramidobacter piscolens]EFB89699.1 hypothetical protein HMPREF7215_2437 [Pyramidobacter piscolens W5455]BDF78464.1 hypothetical protein CE91St28_12580 [Pyramidobacter piscolens]